MTAFFPPVAAARVTAPTLAGVPKFPPYSAPALETDVLTATAPELESQLTQLVDGGQHHIVLDLKDVEYMSSAGLRAVPKRGLSG